MLTKVIVYGQDYQNEMTAFTGEGRTARCNGKVIARHYEHRIETKAYAVNGKVIVIRHDDRLDHDTVKLFETRDEYNAWMQDNDPRGNYDIENGNAPFGYQRSPSAARERIEATVKANRNQDSIPAVRAYFAKLTTRKNNEASDNSKKLLSSIRNRPTISLDELIIGDIVLLGNDAGRVERITKQEVIVTRITANGDSGRVAIPTFKGQRWNTMSKVELTQALSYAKLTSK